MTASAPTAYSRLGIVSGWALALLYVAHSAVTVTLARTDRALPLREDLRGWHYLVGTLLFLAAAVRLWAWLRERPRPPAGHGVHRYYFRLFALQVEKLDVPDRFTATDVLEAMKTNLLGEAAVLGTYTLNPSIGTR